MSKSGQITRFKWLRLVTQSFLGEERLRDEPKELRRRLHYHRIRTRVVWAEIPWNCPSRRFHATDLLQVLNFRRSSRHLRSDLRLRSTLFGGVSGHWLEAAEQPVTWGTPLQASATAVHASDWSVLSRGPRSKRGGWKMFVMEFTFHDTLRISTNCQTRSIRVSEKWVLSFAWF